MANPERRNHSRKEVLLDVNVFLADRQAVAKGKVHNISLGGAFIEMNPPLPTQSEVEIEFVLPVAPHTIRCMGTVVWSVDEPGESGQEFTGIGVQLSCLGPTELSFIAGLLKAP